MDEFRTCPKCGRLLLGSWPHDCVPTVEHARLCPSIIHTEPDGWPAAEATVPGIYAEQPRLGGVRRTYCERCADLLEQIGVFTTD